MPQFRADIDVTSKASTTAQGVLIGTQTTMPAPSVNNVGCTVKYIGTAGTYTPGRYYTCVQSGSGYIWQEAETIATGLDLDTGSRAVVTNGSGMAAVSNVTSTELGYLDGVTSGIQSQLNGKVPTSRTINGHALTENVTLKISDLENDSGFITSTVSNLSNYYTKTQTYTKTEVDSRLDAINSMNVSVVSTLPQTGDPHTIYLVPKSASGNDAHLEYLYVSGKWELIGDTSVDLSNYYTKAEVNSRDVSSASWSSNALRIYHTDGTYDSAAPSGAVSTVMTSNLSASKVVVTNSSGKLTASSTITTTELGYLNGVTSSIQTQLNNKVPTSRTINGHALTGNITLTQSDLGIDIPEINVTANRAVVSDSTGALTASAVTSTELGYLDGVTSAIQTQLNNKQASITGGASTITASNLTANRALVSNASGKVAASTVTAAQLGYLSEVTSSIQDQLNNKADADTEITGGAFSNNTLTLNREAGNINIGGFPNGGAQSVDVEIDGMILTVTVDGNSSSATIPVTGLNSAQIIIPEFYIETKLENDARTISGRNATWSADNSNFRTATTGNTSITAYTGGCIFDKPTKYTQINAVNHYNAVWAIPNLEIYAPNTLNCSIKLTSSSASGSSQMTCMSKPFSELVEGDSVYYIEEDYVFTLTINIIGGKLNNIKCDYSGNLSPTYPRGYVCFTNMYTFSITSTNIN